MTDFAAILNFAADVSAFAQIAAWTCSNAGVEKTYLHKKVRTQPVGKKAHILS
jgi:hypothetical protein